MTCARPVRRPGPTDAARELLGVAVHRRAAGRRTAPLEPGVVIAGAGSGKTTVMAARVVWLVASGQVRPEQVLGLTFTNKAAAELASRIRAGARARLPPVGSRPRRRSTDGRADAWRPTTPTRGGCCASTVCGSASSLRRGCWPTRRVSSSPSGCCGGRAARSESSTRRCANLVGDVVAARRRAVRAPRVDERTCGIDAGLLAELELPAQTRGQRSRIAMTRPLRKRARAGGSSWTCSAPRRTGSACSTSATSSRAASRLVSEHPRRRPSSASATGWCCSTSTRTPRSRSGCCSRLSSSGTAHPVTAVGDPCQAIYGWRGASVGNIDAFPSDFPRADGRPASRFTLRAEQPQRRAAARSRQRPVGDRCASATPGCSSCCPRPGVEARRSTCAVALSTTYGQEVGLGRRRGRASSSTAEALARATSPCWSAYARDFAALPRRAGWPRRPGRGRRPRRPARRCPRSPTWSRSSRCSTTPTANPSLLRLLTGPRWRIGPRDLALLGRRAAELVRARPGDDARRGDRRRLQSSSSAAWRRQWQGSTRLRSRRCPRRSSGPGGSRVLGRGADALRPPGGRARRPSAAPRRAAARPAAAGVA